MTVYGMTLPAATVAALQRALDELRTQAPYVYPWDGLEGGIRLVGYGSLLNAASAARTLAPAGPRRAVLAFGARRLFDSEMSAAALQAANDDAAVAHSRTARHPLLVWPRHIPSTPRR